MSLRFIGITRTEHNVRSSADRRCKVTRVIAKYYGTDGEEYRKAFEAKGTPVVPENGTHEELNSKRYQ